MNVAAAAAADDFGPSREGAKKQPAKVCSSFNTTTAVLRQFEFIDAAV